MMPSMMSRKLTRLAEELGDAVERVVARDADPVGSRPR